jgi:hypothetical protein
MLPVKRGDISFILAVIGCAVVLDMLGHMLFGRDCSPVLCPNPDLYPLSAFREYIATHTGELSLKSLECIRGTEKFR